MRSFQDIYSGYKGFRLLTVLCISLAIVFWGCCFKAEAAQVTASAANVRSQPSMNGEIEGMLYQGAEVTILQWSGEWAEVQSNGLTGWMNQSVLSERAPQAPANPVYATVTGSSVYLRSGAGQEYAVLATLTRGTRLFLLEYNPSWSRVQTEGGAQGYIFTDYIESQQQPAAAVSQPQPQTSEQRTPVVYIDGTKLSFPDVEPMIEAGRTLVPMRAIFEAMGAKVEWIADSKTVVGISRDEKTIITLKIDNKTASVNGKSVSLDVPAQIRNDRTVVPLRFIGESFGATVNWDAASYRIDIAAAAGGTQKPAEAINLETVSTGETLSGSVVPAISGGLDVSRNYLDVAIEENELGLSVKLRGDKKLNPLADKENNVLKMEFYGMYVKERVELKKALGGGDLKLDADNSSEGVLMTLTMPESVECQFEASEDGRSMTLLVENRIRGISRKVYGENDELITIDTVVPVKYQYLVHEDNHTMELVLSNTAKGIAKEKYSYLGSVMDFMTVQEVQGEEGKEVHLLLKAKQSCKFNTMLTDEGVLNIALTTAESYTPRSERFVVVDAGHGGTEKGAIYGGVDERNLNLQIALKLGTYLTSQGIEVAYTRIADTTVSLLERAEMANEQGATLFVSVHCNAATNETANGTETYFYAPISNPTLFAQRMERQEFAKCVQMRVAEANGLYNRGTKESNLAVLRETLMPSVLVECGFVSNDAERAKLMDEGFQQKIAEGIGNGIIEYMNKSLNNLTIIPK